MDTDLEVEVAVLLLIPSRILPLTRHGHEERLRKGLAVALVKISVLVEARDLAWRWMGRRGPREGLGNGVRLEATPLCLK